MNNNNETIIEFGLTENYISDWTVRDALREVYQNFIDYGDYDEIILNNIKPNIIYLSNDFKPKSLDFLTLGTSIKKEGAIGKHGEGLKMAMLVFLRNNLEISISFDNYTITPLWVKKDNINNNIFAIKIETIPNSQNVFSVYMEISTSDIKYIDTILKDEDIMFTYAGSSIIYKPKGTLYIGKLYVGTFSDLSKAYSLSPLVIPLDRDRKVPPSFNVSYHASKVNEEYIKSQKTFDVNSIGYSDTKYINELPETFVKSVKPIIVNESIQYTTTVIDEETNKPKTIVIEQSNIIEVFKKTSFLSIIVDKLKKLLVKAVKGQELAQMFYDKYCHDEDTRTDFKILMARFFITLDENKN